MGLLLSRARPQRPRASPATPEARPHDGGSAGWKAVFFASRRRNGDADHRVTVGMHECAAGICPGPWGSNITRANGSAQGFGFM